MTTGLALGGMLGLGLYLIVTGLPFGRRRPDLATRLRGLTARGRMELDEAGPPSSRLPLVGGVVQPLLDDAGAALSGLLARVGLDGRELERRLAATTPGVTPAQFRGQQIAAALVGFGALPLLNVLGVHPGDGWHVWMWWASSAVGFLTPARGVSSRWRRRREALDDEAPVTFDLVAIAGSAGMSPEQAVTEVGRCLDGPMGEALRRVVADAEARVAGYADGLDALAEREDVSDLRSFAGTYRRSEEQGLPLGRSMLAFADGVRERRRMALREAGGKAAERMLVPTVLLIFPALLAVLLYPAADQLLGMAR